MNWFGPRRLSFISPCKSRDSIAPKSRSQPHPVSFTAQLITSDDLSLWITVPQGHTSVFAFPPSPNYATHLRILDNDRLQSLALFLLDVHGLHVAVQLLLGTLLVVALPRDAYPESIGDAFDAGFPDFLVELWVETDVGGALWVWVLVRGGKGRGKGRKRETYHAYSRELLDLLDRPGSALLKLHAMNLYKFESVFRPKCSTRNLSGGLHKTGGMYMCVG